MTQLYHIIFLFGILQAGARCEAPEKVDFVIVGAGTAGCVLAGRLCASLPDAKIVLIERGVPRNEETEFLVRTPRNLMRTRTNPLISEVYQSEPEPGLLGQTQTIISGKTLGGSSSINGMQWMVPIDDTADSWKIAGLSSANWKRYLRRVFRKVGFAEPPEDLQQIYTSDYIDAASGVELPEDRKPFASGVRRGIWVNRLAITPEGRRRDSCTSYVSPVLNTKCSKNLRLLQSATVSRILLNYDKPPRAYGVEYIVSNGKASRTHEIHARKEVLIAAGPFESPKLLQLSGIGPRKVLKHAGVKPRVALGVGMRTQGRVRNLVVSLYTGVPEEPFGDFALVNSPESIRKWQEGKGGLLGVGGSCVNGVLRRSSYFTATFLRTEAGPNGMPILVSACLPNPKSFGHLRIKDSNPFSTPTVKLNVFRTRSEVKKLRACMSRLSKLHAQFKPPFQLTQLQPPNSNITTSFLRSTSENAFHFVGGCKVDSVVKRDLKVKGVRGLRVIDASVFKTMPLSAGPLASVYVIAEFMAERLAQIYGH